MGKADKLNLTGTTNRRIGKKDIPDPPQKEQTSEEIKAPVVKEGKKTEVKEKKGKIKKTNVELTEEMHFKAKVTAMEQGSSLKDYITKLIEADLKKKGKL